MGTRYIDPTPQMGDTGGESIAGARLFFFASGTSTPLDTFSDEALSVANANPVVCDADGRVPDIFLSLVDYKVVLKEPVEDVTIWERDPVAGAAGDASDITYTATGSGADERTVQEKLDDRLSIWDFGVVGDDVVDDGPAFHLAIAAAKVAKVGLVIPGARSYFIDTESDSAGLDLQHIDFMGEGVSPSKVAFLKGQLPVFRFGSSVTDCIRVGVKTGASEPDFSTVGRFVVDMTSSPANARGVFCDKGMFYKTLKDIYIRANNTDWVLPSAPTAAELLTTNQTAFDLKIDDTATQGIYYCSFHNLISFNFQEGFNTEGDTNDGMRVCNIGTILSWVCNKGITFKDTAANFIALLGIQGFPVGHDPSGAIPTEYGILMSGRKPTTIAQCYIEGSGSSGTPAIFSQVHHNWLNIRDYDVEPELKQIITSSNVRVAGPNRSAGHLQALSGHLEVLSIAGPNIQENLLANGDFRLWEGGSSNIADGINFALSWTSVKEEASATFDIVQRTGSSNTLTYDNSVRLEVTNSIGDNKYGMKQDISDFIPLSGTKLSTMGTTIEKLTLAVIHRPFIGNASAVRFRCIVDDGVTVTTKDFISDYDFIDDVNQDSTVVGAAGQWQTMLVPHELNVNATKLEVTVSIFPEANTAAEIGTHVDNVLLYVGDHTQYGMKPNIKSADFFIPAGLEVNTNAVPANSAVLYPVGQADDGTIFYGAAYASKW